MSTDHPAAEPVNPLTLWSPNAEDCAACDHVEGACPYHLGVWNGISWFAQAMHALAVAPDIADTVHGVIAERRELQAAWARVAGTGTDIPVPAAKTAPLYDVEDIAMHGPTNVLWRVESRHWAGASWLYRCVRRSVSMVISEGDFVPGGVPEVVSVDDLPEHPTDVRAPAHPVRLQVARLRAVDGGGPR